MASNSKGGKASPGKFMDSGVGLCSYKSNPMKAANQVSRKCGPGMNPDQRKANGLLQKAYSSKESLRGMSGM